MTPAAEWLIDNYYLVEREIREIRSALPSGYYRQLPKLLGAFAEAGPWVALDFLLAPDEALGGETPLQVLRREGLTPALERLARIEQGDGFA